MPPIKGTIWSHFNHECNETGAIKQVTCKFCGAHYGFPNATRMRNHLLKCKECPPNITKHYASNSKEGSGWDTDTPEYQEIPDDPLPQSNADSSTTMSAPPSKKQKQTSMKSFTDSIGQEEKRELDSLFARAAFSKGAPLSIFEGVHMQNAFQKLRSVYKPPDHFKMRTSLLNAEYDLAQHSLQEEVKEAYCVAMMSDGWMNGRSEGLINFVFATPHPVFIKTIEQGYNKEDSDFLSQKMIQIIEEYGQGKVFIILTDNAPVMRAAWRKVQIKYPHVLTAGCGCHGLDLMIKHTVSMGSIKALYRRARSAVHTIKKKKVIKALFRKYQKEKYGEGSVALKLPSKTRFFGAYTCLDALITNKSALQATAISEAVDIPTCLRSTILDNEDFWVKVNFVARLMKPIAEGIRLIECTDAKLSHLVAVLMNIQIEVNKCLNEDDNPLDILGSRRVQGVILKFTKFILKDVHLAVYLVDPNFRGKGLSDEKKLQATELIKKIARSFNLDEDSVLLNLLHFQTKSNFYSKDTLWRSALTMDALKWWSALCSQQPLSPVALRLLSAPPSSASCERIWSDYDHIHSKKRNRLTNERLEKLVAVKRHLNSTDFKLQYEKNTESLKNRMTTLTSYPTADLEVVCHFTPPEDLDNMPESDNGSDESDNYSERESSSDSE